MVNNTVDTEGKFYLSAKDYILFCFGQQYCFIVLIMNLTSFANTIYCIKNKLNLFIAKTYFSVTYYLLYSYSTDSKLIIFSTGVRY